MVKSLKVLPVFIYQKVVNCINKGRLYKTLCMMFDNLRNFTMWYIWHNLYWWIVNFSKIYSSVLFFTFESCSFWHNLQYNVVYTIGSITHQIVLPIPSISCSVSKQQKKICKEKKAQAFYWDKCCHLAICLWLILFHWIIH